MAAANTYSQITGGSVTLATAASSVTFSSIPATFTDLVLVTSVPGFTGGNNSRGYRFELNADTGTNYSCTQLNNSTTTSVSSRESSQTRGRIGFLSETTNDVSNGMAHFMNYSNSTTYKTVLGRTSNMSSNGDANVFAGVSLWRSTAAINAIKLTLSDNSNFPIGSTFNLYGILAA
jgi:hypothetical protein